MKKLFFIVAMFTVMTVFSAYVSADEIKTGGYEPIQYLGEVELSNVVEYEYNPRARAIVPDWLSNGSRNFYNHIGTLENGERLQSLYNKIYNALYNYTYDAGGKVTVYNNRSYVCVEISEYNDINDGSLTFKIYNAVLQDNPQFFYLDVYTCRFVYGNLSYYGFQVCDEYVNGTDRIAEADAITEGIAEYDKIINKNLSNYAIEKKVHDKLIIDNTYALDENNQPETARYAHSVSASLNKAYGGGVCESYSKTTQLLLNRYGVNCYSVMGVADDTNHMWNFIQLNDGNYYCYDATWDDPVSLSGYKYLKYDYFNKPYTSFYSGRDNSLTYFTEALPKCSESTAFYTSKPGTTTGQTIDGNIVYIAPDISEDETRVVTESATETTTFEPTTEGKTEVTTNTYQFLAQNSPMDITVVLENNSWALGRFTDGGNFAAGYDGATMSVTVDEACMIEYIIQFNGASDVFSVYLDDKLVHSTSTTGIYVVNVPAGTHKIKWVYTKVDGSYCLFRSIDAISKADTNRDGNVDMKDVIYILSQQTIDISKVNYWDINGDNVVGNADAALILRKISKMYK